MQFLHIRPHIILEIKQFIGHLITSVTGKLITFDT